MQHRAEEVPIRKVVAGLYVSLGGIVEAPEKFRLMVHPVVVGSGKRLFEVGGNRRALELVDSRTFGTGVVCLTYRPADEG